MTLNPIKFVRLMLLKVSVPASHFIALFHRPECLILEDDFDRAAKLLQDGDIVMSKTFWELSNFCLPGILKHCGVYIDGRVYNATTSGVRDQSLAEFAYKKDVLCAARLPVPLTKEEVKLGCAYLKTTLGSAYDWTFSWTGTKAFYCSKLCYYFLLAARPEIQYSFKLIDILGEITVKPEDFWQATKVFNRVFSINLKE